MVFPDVDPPPNFELIANRKGKRATADEKAEIYRLSEAGFTRQQLIEITQRSEDSIGKYIKELDAGTEATIRARAEAYQHMVSPTAPPQRQARQPEYDDDYDDDDYEAPPSQRSGPPPPAAPEIELDLDDLFEEDDLVDPSDEDALAKKLYVLLLQKKAVKGPDAEDDAKDIAQDFRMYPDYHNPHGLVEFLRGHEIKERKANLVARLLFGWQNQASQQPGFDPGPVPGWHPGMPRPPPSTPVFNQFQQPWGGGYTGYGVPGQPTPGQYPYPWPAPPQMPPTNEKGGINKAQLQDILEKRDKQLHEHYTKIITEEREKRDKDEEKRARKEEMDELRAANQRLEARLTELSTNPQTAPPDGNYEAVETPVFDEEGNVVRVNTTYRRLEDPVVKEMNQKYDDLLAEFKEERKEYKAEMKAMLEAKGQLEIEKLKAESAGEIDLWKEKKAHLDDLRDKMADADKELYAKEKELMEMKYKKSDDQPLELQKVDKQIEFLREAKNQARDFRKDAMKFIMVMSGKGRPEGVVEEQWTDEELAGMK